MTLDDLFDKALQMDGQTNIANSRVALRLKKYNTNNNNNLFKNARKKLKRNMSKFRFYQNHPLILYQISLF